MPVGWPLTGRADELRLLGELGTARDGPAGVVLAGAPGVGKTRLARATLETAEQRGAVTRWAAATSSARGLPLGAFSALVGSVGSDRMFLLQRATEAVLAGAGSGGVVVGVDDAHLLDELSATLVHQLVLRREAAVVLTMRSGASAPDAVTRLWKDGHLPRLEVQPLGASETAALLERVLGAPVSTASARLLWAMTRGNVLYLRHLVEGELEAGRLEQVGGVWRWAGHPRLSPGLAELVQERIGRPSDPQRDVVEMLAFGEPLGVPLLVGLTSAEAVEEAEAQGLIEVHPDGRRLQARLAHPLYGELQRARCGEVRARRLRGRIATALAGTGSRRADDVLRRAVLAMDSDIAPDPALLTAALERARPLADAALMERLARAAMAAGVNAYFEMSWALTMTGRHDEAYEEILKAAELAENDVRRTQATVFRVSMLFWSLARPADAEAVLGAAMASVADDHCRHLLAGIGSVVDAVLCRPHKAVAAATDVLASPPSTQPTTPFPWISACWGLATACGGLGRLDLLSGAMAQIRAVPDTIDRYIRHVGGIGNAYSRALRLAGLLAEAEREAQEAVERFQPATGVARPVSEVIYGLVLLDQGRVSEAARWFRQALADVRGSEPAWAYISALSLAQALAMAGDPKAAREAAGEMEALHHPSLVFREPDLLLARAWVAAAEGALNEARTVARQAAELAASQTQPAVEVVALHTAVCLGDRGLAARLAELATQVDGPRAPAVAAHAAALAAGDGDALLAASVQLEQIGARLLAADAAAQAALAFTTHGRRGSAQTATARAHRLADRCDGARTPALAALGAPITLTDREREILTLAGDGLSNRAIAERLVVSVRTIEGHLYRACAKLGTSDRAQFATLLRATRVPSSSREPEGE